MVLPMVMLMLDLPLVVKPTKTESTMITTMPTETRPIAVTLLEPFVFESMRDRPFVAR